MRELVLASAALLAVALTAPFAGAQYADPSTTSPAYETQVPTASTTTPGTVDDPAMTTATPSPSTSATTTTDMTGQMATTQTDPYAQPAQTTAQSESMQHPMDQSSVATTAQAQTGTQTTTDTYGQTHGDTRTHGQAQVYPVDLTETAEMAGMDAVPMSAADVCQTRTVELAQGTSRLNTSSRRHLKIAADHASVCEIERVVVRSPNGRADAVRQTLVEHGVNDGVIEVQTADDGQLGVEMRFAGIAASTPQYAAMYNALATSYASTQTQPYAQGTTMNQPSAYETQPAAPGSEPVAYEPVEPAAPNEPQTWRPVDDTSMQDTTASTADNTSYQQPVTTDPSMTTSTTTSAQTTTSTSPSWEEPAEVPAGTY